jgi:hypothetical protein
MRQIHIQLVPFDFSWTFLVFAGLDVAPDRQLAAACRADRKHGADKGDLQFRNVAKR